MKWVKHEAITLTIPSTIITNTLRIFYTLPQFSFAKFQHESGATTGSVYKKGFLKYFAKFTGKHS